MHKIMSKTRIDRLRVLLRLPLLFIDADQLFSAARVLAKTIVGDSIKPGGEFRFATKSAQVFVGANKSVLGQIVRKRKVAARELAQQTANARLMPAHQLAKSVLVVIEKNSGDKCGIG
ncbi:MAG: hypothetical protein QOJ36_1275 [Verrucomicrobiota bacterium]